MAAELLSVSAGKMDYNLGAKKNCLIGSLSTLSTPRSHGPLSPLTFPRQQWEHATH